MTASVGWETVRATGFTISSTRWNRTLASIAARGVMGCARPAAPRRRHRMTRMTHGTFPRQPREGEPDNAARVVAHTGPTYTGVECMQTDSIWLEVAQFAGPARARDMRDALNLI